MTNTARKTRYGKTIPTELRWLRTVGAGELILGTMYTPARLRQLVQAGGLTATSTPGTYTIAAITDQMIAETES